jgi:hypothetical protein
MALTKTTNRMKQGAFVNVFDFMTPAQIASVQAGDLAEDVTSAISTAWASFSAGTMFIPNGTYKTTSKLDFSYVSAGNNIYKGIYSEGAIFKPSGNDITCMEIGNGTVHRGFYLDGQLNIDMDNTTGSGSIGFSNGGQAWRYQINNLLVTNGSGVGIKLVDGSYGGQWNNIEVTGVGSYGLQLQGASPSSAVTTNQFNSCYFINCGNSAVKAYSAHNMTFINLNTASSNSDVGPEVDLESCYSWVLQGGLIENGGTSGVGVKTVDVKYPVFLTAVNAQGAGATEFDPLPSGGLFYSSNRVPLIPDMFGRSITLANDAIEDLGERYSKLFIQSTGLGRAAEFYLKNGSSKLIWEDTTGNFSTTAGSSGDVNVYWDAVSSTHKVENKSGSLGTFTLQFRSS